MSPEQLKDLYARRARVFDRRPVLALVMEQTRVVLEDGLAGTFEHDGRLAGFDLPAGEGGAGEAAAPAALMRASLAASLAQGYRLWAARLDVPIGAVTVDLACAFDARGALDLASADVPVGWQEMLVHVTIASTAPEDDVRRLVETADRLSPLLANLSFAVHRVHRLTIVPAERSVPPEVTPKDSQDANKQRPNRKGTP